jgi:transposase
MGTNSKAGGERAGGRGPYKHHPLAFKRAVVEASLQHGASVARLAREHGINANQIFYWRKLHREGTLGESSPALLPITIEPSAVTASIDEEPPAGNLTIETGRIRLRIEGRPDAQTLRLILAELRRS